MNGARTYLDYNASAPLRPEAREAVVAALGVAGNPSSVHAEGRAARAVVEEAREKVASLVGARPSEVVFTSGATESCNWVLRQPWRTVYCSDVEHAAVRAPCLAADGRLVRLPVGADGMIDVAHVAAALDARAPGASAGRNLLVVQAANNETGVLQPVAALADLARTHGVSVFSDAVQAAGRIPLDMAGLGVDVLALSAHKIGGPKGVGALVFGNAGAGNAVLEPMLAGGGQERRRRGGTENVAAIAGFGAAAAAAGRDLPDMRRIAALRDRLESEAKRIAPDTIVIGTGAPRLANTSALALPGYAAERMVIALDLAGVAVSAGSACASGKVGQSGVLAAMGVADAIAKSVIRVSLGHATTTADIEAFLAALARLVARRSPAMQDGTTSLSAAASPTRARITA